MAKKKVNRVSNTRRPRIPNGHERVEVILPKETCHRIGDHVLRHEGLTVQDFLKKAIYDALPVHYEVTEDFVFPFGKYAGETAGVVKRIDPSYLQWCKKNIPGFNTSNWDMEEYCKNDVELTKEVSGIVPALYGTPSREEMIAKMMTHLHVGEMLVLGGRYIKGQKAFGVSLEPWGQKKFRFIGYVPV